MRGELKVHVEEKVKVCVCVVYGGLVLKRAKSKETLTSFYSSLSVKVYTIGFVFVLLSSYSKSCKFSKEEKVFHFLQYYYTYYK